MSYHILLHGVQSTVRAQLMALSKERPSYWSITQFWPLQYKMDEENVKFK